jgi:nucleoid DNA-binding protein
MKITKKKTITDLARMFAKRYGVSIIFAKEFIQDTFQLVGDVLYEDGEDIYLSKFGTFKHHKTEDRYTVHPKTREKVLVPGRDVIKFVRAADFEPFQEIAEEE